LIYALLFALDDSARRRLALDDGLAGARRGRHELGLEHLHEALVVAARLRRHHDRRLDARALVVPADGFESGGRLL